MEKDFYTDDFEQLLKDTTDDFRMYPSRKVWHSIYNDLHPARKWPSFAVCLLLITSILYVGIHNNNTINADAENLLFSALSPVDNSDKDFTHVVTSSTTEEISGVGELNSKKSATAQINKKQHSFVNNFSGSNIIPYKIPAENIAGAPANIRVPEPASIIEEINETKIIPATIDPTNVNISIQPGNIYKNENDEKVISAGNPEHQLVNPSSANNPISGFPGLTDKANITSVSEAEKNKSIPVANTRNAQEVMWIEDYAFHNKRNSNKWKTKLSTVVYFTPSIGYRSLHKNNNFEPVNALLIRSSATTVDAEDAITQQAALNMEIGASLLADLNKNLKVKAGVQVSYNNYISYAQKLSHPTQTNVLLNDLNTGNTLLVPFSTMYANKPGENFTRLNNKTIQFSLPIGADYKLAGNENLKWYIGATIQPTYVAGGNAYLVSSDYKNYVDMPSMHRTWNMNVGFESFISYKTRSGSYINLGPQFRYQLMSTYSNRYTYTENLYNIGIKVGIMRKL